MMGLGLGHRYRDGGDALVMHLVRSQTKNRV